MTDRSQMIGRMGPTDGTQGNKNQKSILCYMYRNKSKIEAVPAQPENQIKTNMQTGDLPNTQSIPISEENPPNTLVCNLTLTSQLTTYDTPLNFSTPPRTHVPFTTPPAIDRPHQCHSMQHTASPLTLDPHLSDCLIPATEGLSTSLSSSSRTCQSLITKFLSRHHQSSVPQVADNHPPSSTLLTAPLLHTQASTTPPSTQQRPITDFFSSLSSADHQTQLSPSKPNTSPRRKTSHRQKYSKSYYLLKYDPPYPANQDIRCHFISQSLKDLHGSRGHSLISIDTSTTFRLFLQNPNGLTLYDANYSLLYDMDTCRKYGAAALCLPETKTNWSRTSQHAALKGILHRTWNASSYQTSRAAEPFLSSYQPGGTATIVCGNWTARIMSKGEDPTGMGRWSYMILRGKGTRKIAIITAYNVCSTHTAHRGDSTAYQQQYRILSNLLRQHNMPAAPHPHRQLILDLQAWVEHLIADNHEIILALDANEPYNPDIPGTVHSLPYPKD